MPTWTSFSFHQIQKCNVRFSCCIFLYRFVLARGYNYEKILCRTFPAYLSIVFIDTSSYLLVYPCMYYILFSNSFLKMALLSTWDDFFALEKVLMKNNWWQWTQSPEKPYEFLTKFVRYCGFNFGIFNGINGIFQFPITYWSENVYTWWCNSSLQKIYFDAKNKIICVVLGNSGV